MSIESSEQVLDYPLRAPTALEPPEEWAKLRQGCPVAHVRLPSGDSAVLLTRYSDVRQVLADPRFTRQLGKDGAAKLSEEGGSVFETEEAASLTEGHERWRRLLHKSFTAKRVQAMQPRIEAMADQLIDDMVRQGPPADLVAGLAFPLPVWVICELLGIPDIDRDKLAFWSNAMLNMSQYTRQEMEQAQVEFAQYMTAHIAAKRAAPGEDLLSELVAAVDDGHPLTERELMMIGQGILVAGHETTSNTIAKMMAMLLSERSRWEQLLADPSLVRTAVEEVLRFDANAGFGLPRFITEEIEVSGQKLAGGTTVICNMAAANRDEQAYERADTMDLTRSPNPHLTFGVGPHSCVGQALARTELQTTLNVLLRRLPTLELAIPSEQLARREGLLIGGLERVPVRW
ncbi:Cytochrome P450 [Nannocystis exedens]|uniref:Cytochrome P450 n=1 Tax=Nannocystis exedens TaxID=54 RepID=A0A1I1UDH9_9BACT|nr:cytochrome P450 [Nannocystis exedens]PCC71619.1 cytochrome [Nannocystis exedens]SFD68799.1 Cytochrome P450 [Nannocystis exedens]